MENYKETDIIGAISTNKTTVMKNSLFQYALFIGFIICIILHNSNISDKNNADIATISKELDYIGAECAYSIKIGKSVRVWQKSRIFISFNPTNACSSDVLSRLNEDGRSVFRVHAYSVYEMVTTASRYIGNQTYEAELLLTFPTKYIVMVILTYVNGLALESRRHVKPILRQVRNSPFNLNLIRSESPRHIAAYCTKNQSGYVSGRWLKCGGSIPGLERCGPWQAPDFDFDHIHGFRWVPYVCQYHQYTNDEVKKCFARKGWDSIVFAGDSHMRYRAYHWVTRLYGSCHACVKTHIKMVFNKVPRIEWIFDARGTRLPLTFPNITLPLEKYIHPKVRRSKFSTPFPVDAMQGKLFLLNFGHWVLREVNDVNFLRQKVEAYAEAAKILQNTGKTVVWVNTVSLPWRTDQSVIEWRENTSPYRVNEFNKLTDAIMREHGIPVVDAFQISDGRIAATHDQTHYTKKLTGNDFGGVVENAITNTIFNQLCNK
ncbi:uncharacterized protein LOC130640683 [Hydractinia symbiolongicarpus]|uniref:uncharacterized protein LOC130640683 n=1 Tax=Hydractinia symbiolongicarpus TaxID=13093 RepID=UPI002549EF97|nr:uncharacterized protein LOC130640683 [Hydractinia symbiolongicarpus]